jgi:hypothetical protein
MQLVVVESGEDSYEQPLIFDAEYSNAWFLQQIRNQFSRTFMRNLVQRLFFTTFTNTCPGGLSIIIVLNSFYVGGHGVGGGRPCIARRQYRRVLTSS